MIAPKLEVDPASFAKVKKLLKQFGEKANAALGPEEYLEGERIMGASKLEVPVDFGNLRSSGHVQLPKKNGAGWLVELGFGGPAAPYALAVHENPRSGKTGGVSPSGGKYSHYAKTGGWKYLERPFNAARKGMDGRIAAGMKRRLGI